MVEHADRFCVYCDQLILSSLVGMKGRLLWQSIVLIFEGLLVIAFAHTNTLSTSLGVLIMFSMFVQAAEGSTYGIVPYVNPLATGSISGIIGAGGNVGAVIFGLFFREFETKTALISMGIVIFSSSFLSLFICIPGYVDLFFRTDSITRGADILVPTLKPIDVNRDSTSLNSDNPIHFPLRIQADE